MLFPSSWFPSPFAVDALDPSTHRRRGALAPSSTAGSPLGSGPSPSCSCPCARSAPRSCGQRTGGFSRGAWCPAERGNHSFGAIVHAPQEINCCVTSCKLVHTNVEIGALMTTPLICHASHEDLSRFTWPQKAFRDECSHEDNVLEPRVAAGGLEPVVLPVHDLGAPASVQYACV